MKKIFTLLLFTSITLFSQEGFHYQWHKHTLSSSFTDNQNDTIYHLVQIANVSNYNAFAVISKTSRTWSYLTSPTFSYNSISSHKLYMRNYNDGILTLGGNSGLITHDHWQTSTTYSASIPIMSNQGATPFGYFGYANNSGTYSRLFSTDCVNWNAVSTQSMAPIFSRSQDRLYATENGALRSSSDGGATYSVINSTHLITRPFLVPNNDTLFYMNDSLEYSFDGGVNWGKYSVPTTSVAQIAAKNGKELMIIDALGSLKNIYYSNNSGLSWTTYTTIPSGYIPNTYYSQKLTTNKDEFILYPDYRSKDGSSWKAFIEMAPPTKPYDVTVTGDIVLVGEAQGYFGFSLNKGQTFNFFESAKVSGTSDLMAVKAINDTVFLAADRNTNIYISSNQGQSWTKKTNAAFNTPRKFSVSADGSIIVLSALGGASVSFDGGNSFVSLNTASGSGHYQSMKPTSRKIVDVTPLYPSPSYTLTGFDFYDIDNTNTRTLMGSISVSTDQLIIDVQMLNDNIGYLMTRVPSTDETVVYKTTNGWVNVNAIATIPTPTTGVRAYEGRYGNIYTFGTDTVIISGSGNPINNQVNFYHISTDGGVTWNIVHPGFSVPAPVLGDRIYKMAFFNPTEYISLISSSISGSAQASVGVYLKTNSTPDNILGIKELYQTPSNNQLRVFPNPSHDLVSVDLTGFNRSDFEVNVFNIYGQEVKKVKISSENPSIDVSGLSDGIYFIQLTIGDKQYSTKFIKY